MDRRKLLRRLAPFLFWAGLLVLLEVGLRVAKFEFNPYGHYSKQDWGVFEEGRNRVDYLADPEVFWRLIPSRTIESQFGPNAHVNAHGFRGPECLVRRDPAVTRVVTLGDSGTFGWAVLDDECYPRQLEAILNASAAPRRFEVINAGVPGYTSLQGMRWLEMQVLRFRPDVAVLAYGGNDPDPLPTADKDRRLSAAGLEVQSGLLHSRIYQFAYKCIAVDLVAAKKSDASRWPERVALPDFIANYERMIALLEKEGGKCVFVGRPGPRPVEYMGAVEEIARRHGAPYIENGICGHPPASGYRLTAQLVAKAILGDGATSRPAR